MCASQASTVQTLEEIIRRFAPKQRSQVPLNEDTRLVDDAGIDSPRMIDIVLEIEDRMGVTIEDETVQKVVTFGDLVRLVQGFTKGNASHA